MSTIIQNGDIIGFSTNEASFVNYTDAKGNKSTVQNEISGLKQNIADLKEWKFVGQTTSLNTNVSLPSNWNEVSIYVSIGSTSEITYCLNVRTERTTVEENGAINLHTGYYSASNSNAVCVAKVGIDYALLSSMRLNGANTSALMKVYCR